MSGNTVAMVAMTLTLSIVDMAVLEDLTHVTRDVGDALKRLPVRMYDVICDVISGVITICWVGHSPLRGRHRPLSALRSSFFIWRKFTREKLRNVVFMRRNVFLVR